MAFTKKRLLDNLSSVGGCSRINSLVATKGLGGIAMRVH